MKSLKTAALSLFVLAFIFSTANAQYSSYSQTASATAIEEAEAPNIVDLVTSNDDFSTLAMLLTEAGLVETVREAGDITVFAPTNAAFEQVSQTQLQALLADHDLLREVLLTHVIGATVTSDVVTQIEEAPTAANNVLPVVVNDSGVRVGNAKVTDVDIMASNGVVHVVDAVIMPPAEGVYHRNDRNMDHEQRQRRTSSSY
ncbi:Uncaracterized surface protein [Cyclonatronum proteinivorum]|uniref:Uncaracterized surface protein n=1 Tax=Cyclonatronum proteinivorum TaxID=1457365 RepID=A0A345UNM7_9BACT|nr:fasciclin domain-containing protein [Cyclonatronum proteinivorum]AXJ02079.1 Uncaracterized surface protein [Cyclonatronum proteinivorum]